jgi:putative oxidoreductase
MRGLFVLGRVVFGGFFVYNGISHFRNQAGMSRYAGAKGVPAAEAAVPATGALLIAGGLSIVTGVKPRLGLAAIMGFLIPVTLQMHRFWEETDPQRQLNESVNFARNMALVGASMMMMQIEDPWPASVDEARAADEELFIRLGGREFRALPA